MKRVMLAAIAALSLCSGCVLWDDEDEFAGSAPKPAFSEAAK
jgi:hypothetical protein